MSLTTEQLLERRKGIGGSDVAAILGLSQWKTPIDVYNEKVNNEYPIATPRMRWGIRLENAIATEYKEQTGRKIRKCHKIIRHKKYPFLLGNIDRVIISGNGYGPGILEIKTASEISVYLYVIPVISTIASYFLFKDEITIFFILGGMFVIIGLVFVNMKQKNSINKK